MRRVLIVSRREFGRRRGRGGVSRPRRSREELIGGDKLTNFLSCMSA